MVDYSARRPIYSLAARVCNPSRSLVTILIEKLGGGSGLIGIDLTKQQIVPGYNVAVSLIE